MRACKFSKFFCPSENNCCLALGDMNVPNSISYNDDKDELFKVISLTVRVREAVSSMLINDRQV